MTSVIEIICIILITVGFIKNIYKWKKNLSIVLAYVIIYSLFMEYLSKFININSFMTGQPICTYNHNIDGRLCFNYSAIIVYFTGNILWFYQAFPKNYNYSIPNFVDILIYFIRGAAIFGILSGFIQNWTLVLQITIDIFILLFCDINNKFDPVGWIYCNKWKKVLNNEKKD